MTSKTKKALTIAFFSSILTPIFAMDPPIQPIQPFPNNHSIIIPKDQSLCSSLTNSFIDSADMAYLSALLQKRDKFGEDILSPIFSQMPEYRRIQLWKYLKSQYDIESTLYQESLIALRFYWKDEGINVSQIMDAGFSWEEAFKGPFSYLNMDLRITSEQIRSLATNHSLMCLRWNFIGVTFAEVKDIAGALKENQTLTSLEFRCVGIGSRGAKYLAVMLKKNNILKNLNLWGNRIQKEGAQYIAEALRENHTLVNLDLCGNSIGDLGVQYIAEALKDNHTLLSLNLEQNFLKSTKYLAEALKENYTLTNLNLSDNKIEDEGVKNIVEALKENCTLRNLNLSKNEIGNEGAKYLVEVLKVNSTLTLLKLNTNWIGDDAAKILSEFKERVRL